MKPLTEAEFNSLLTAARMLDETWPNLEQELWTREMWVRKEDGLYYYRPLGSVTEDKAEDRYLETGKRPGESD